MEVVEVTGCLHLPKNSGSFGWDVNGKTILVRPNGKFPNIRDVLKGSPKFPTGKSVRKMCVPFAFRRLRTSTAVTQLISRCFEWILVNGTRGISFGNSIRWFCLPFVQTVNQPVSSCKSVVINLCLRFFFFFFFAQNLFLTTEANQLFRKTHYSMTEV